MCSKQCKEILVSIVFLYSSERRRAFDLGTFLEFTPKFYLQLSFIKLYVHLNRFHQHLDIQMNPNLHVFNIENQLIVQIDCYFILTRRVLIENNTSLFIYFGSI